MSFAAVRFRAELKSSSQVEGFRRNMREIEGFQPGAQPMQVFNVLGQSRLILSLDHIPAGAGRYFVSARLGRCVGADERCRVEMRSRIFRNTDLFVLPPDVSARRVYARDCDHDGDTDVLIELSNGAGILIRNAEAALRPPRL